MIGYYIFRLITAKKSILHFGFTITINHFSFSHHLRHLFFIYWFCSDRASTTSLWSLPVLNIFTQWIHGILVIKIMAATP